MSTRRFNQLIQHKTVGFSLHQTVGDKILKSKKTEGGILYLTAAFLLRHTTPQSASLTAPLSQGSHSHNNTTFALY